MCVRVTGIASQSEKIMQFVKVFLLVVFLFAYFSSYGTSSYAHLIVVLNEKFFYSLFAFILFLFTGFFPFIYFTSLFLCVWFQSIKSECYVASARRHICKPFLNACMHMLFWLLVRLNVRERNIDKEKQSALDLY